MSPDDPRHGTTAGHYAHRKDGEPACDACVKAKTRYEKARHVYGDRMVPAIGVRRRIQALKALGHSGAEIGAKLGITYQAVHRLEHSTTDRVFAATAENVRRVFDEMCMTFPTGFHRTRIRNAAARAGYAPPLAWDDIDDPNEQPSGATIASVTPIRERTWDSPDHRACPRCGVVREVAHGRGLLCHDCRIAVA